MSEYVYWQHRTSGEVYAIRIGSDGHLTGAAGPIFTPIDPTDRVAFKLLPFCDYGQISPEQLAEIEAHGDDYDWVDDGRYTKEDAVTCSICGEVIRIAEATYHPDELYPELVAHKNCP